MKKTETRVYVVEIGGELEFAPVGCTDEEFMTEAENNGRVYSINGFVEAFNDQDVNTAIDQIRIIDVEINIFDDYTVSETDSDIIFAIIKDAKNETDLINKVALAVKDEFCYTNVKFIENGLTDKDNTIYICFDCCDDDEEYEVREVKLNKIAIY